MSNDGRFKPGQSKPEGSGRKAGTANKDTQSLIAILEEMKVDPVRDLCGILPQLDPKDRANVNLKLIEFIYPKRKALEIDSIPEERESEVEGLRLATMRKDK